MFGPHQMKSELFQFIIYIPSLETLATQFLIAVCHLIAILLTPILAMIKFIASTPTMAIIIRLSYSIAHYLIDHVKFTLVILFIGILNLSLSLYMGYVSIIIDMGLVFLAVLFLAMSITLSTTTRTNPATRNDPDHSISWSYLVAPLSLLLAQMFSGPVQTIHILLTAHVLVYIILGILLLAFVVFIVVELLQGSINYCNTMANKTNTSHVSTAPTGYHSFSTTTISSEEDANFSLKEFYRKAYEADEGQDTDNKFILVKRHIKAGLPTTPAIMNIALEPVTGQEATQELLDWFSTIKPLEYTYPINSASDKAFMNALLGVRPPSRKAVNPRKPRNIILDERVSGAYHIQQRNSIDSYVGGCIHLNERPFKHLKPSAKGSAPK